MSKIIYLDHAATTPIAPEGLQAMIAYEESGRGNPYRGLHVRAERATDAYDQARATVAKFISASPDELIFTKGTTESLNLVVHGLAPSLGPTDEVILSLLEHHANLLPWRAAAQKYGFTLRFLPMTVEGLIDPAAAASVITDKTKVVALTHVSNVLGTITPMRRIADLAHAHGALVVCDAAQSAGHLPLSVVELGVDALAFGAHKMYGPMGIGALYLSQNLQKSIDPLLLGGGMVEEVLDDGCAIFARDVRKFEAGTPNVTGAVGFAAACEALLQKGMEQIVAHEQNITAYLLENLAQISSLTLYGPRTTESRLGVVSFSVQDMHSHDVAAALSQKHICVRAGYHCAAPLARCLHPDGTVRVSIGKETTKEDVDALLLSLRNDL